MQVPENDIIKKIKEEPSKNALCRKQNAYYWKTLRIIAGWEDALYDPGTKSMRKGFLWKENCFYWKALHDEKQCLKSFVEGRILTSEREVML